MKSLRARSASDMLLPPDCVLVPYKAVRHAALGHRGHPLLTGLLHLGHVVHSDASALAVTKGFGDVVGDPTLRADRDRTEESGTDRGGGLSRRTGNDNCCPGNRVSVLAAADCADALR